jgi:hypothetical protein
MGVEDYWIELEMLQTVFFRITHPLAEEKRGEEGDMEGAGEDTEEVGSSVKSFLLRRRDHA